MTRPDLLDDCRLLRSLYAADTTESPALWTPANPSVGHCHVTALILWARYSGRIMTANVYLAGQPILHYWNDIDGVRVDPTWDQFQRDRPVTGEEWDATHEPIQDGTASRRTLLLSRFHIAQQNPDLPLRRS